MIKTSCSGTLLHYHLHLDQATGKLIRKKIYLVFMNNPEEVVNLLKEILNRVNS